MPLLIIRQFTQCGKLQVVLQTSVDVASKTVTEPGMQCHRYVKTDTVVLYSIHVRKGWIKSIIILLVGSTKYKGCLCSINSCEYLIA